MIIILYWLSLPPSVARLIKHLSRGSLRLTPFSGQLSTNHFKHSTNVLRKVPQLFSWSGKKLSSVRTPRKCYSCYSFFSSVTEKCKANTLSTFHRIKHHPRVRGWSTWYRLPIWLSFKGTKPVVKRPKGPKARSSKFMLVALQLMQGQDGKAVSSL